jgi:LacI family transcriptional regulator
LITRAAGFYGELNRGVHDRLLQDGYATIIGINDQDYDDPGDSVEEKIIHRLNEHRVDGFILRPTLDNATDEHFREIIDMHVPLVTFDRKVKSDYADFVGSDDVAGGRRAAIYLSELGHRNVVQFAADQRVSSYRDRTMGFEAEMIERGCTIQTIFCDTPENIAQKCRLIFTRASHPTAVFCSSDQLGAIVIQELKKLNLTIPDDLSVMGYGNEHMGEYLEPKLTTIDQRPYEMGLAAAELFLERMQEAPGKTHKKRTILIDVDLIERESCRNLD